MVFRASSVVEKYVLYFTFYNLIIHVFKAFGRFVYDVLMSPFIFLLHR